MTAQDEVLRALWKRKYKIPQSRELVEELIRDMKQKGELDEDYLKDFGETFTKMEHQIYERYLAYEREYLKRCLREFFERFAGGGATAVVETVGDHAVALDRLYMTISQSRRSRAGRAFEGIIKGLFAQSHYPFDEQPVINGKPDFIFPSKKYYMTNPQDCIIFTAKRTLRERWKQILIEGTRVTGFFLATIDKKISENQLEEMNKNHIRLVVPESIKKNRYATAPNVITFKDFIEFYLEPVYKKWKRDGIV